MKLLKETTDEDNCITLNGIIEELKSQGIVAERKSIYDDINALRQYGLDIATCKSKTTGYFVANRLFELPELKLLTDIVQSSNFITHKKSNQLIKKIHSLASIHQAKNLQRQVYMTNRAKTINETIYYNVDKIHNAINNNNKISFKYFDYNLNKEKIFRKDGERYTTSPYALSWNDDNYYLIAFSEKYNNFTHYRVDRMTDIEITENNRAELPETEHFNLAEYSKTIFGMFRGREEIVTLQFDNSLVNVVMDRFGNDIYLDRIDDKHFKIRFNIVVSPAFLGWVFQFGGKVKILSPDAVKAEYEEMLRSNLEMLKVES